MGRTLGDDMPNAADVRAAVTSMLGTGMPQSEAGTATPGTQDKLAREDHVHKRLTSATVHTTAANGKQTVMFTRTFDVQPVVMCDLVEVPDNGPVTFKVESWLDDTGAAWALGKPYGGAVVYGYRTREMPTLNLAGIVLIGPLLTALNVISGYKPYVGAGNVGFSCLAIQQSGQ